MSRELLESGAPLIVVVDLQRWNDGFRLTAQDVQPLDEAAIKAAAGLCVFVRDEAPLDSLATVFREHGEHGPGKVRLMLETGDREIEMDLPQGYAISVAVRSAVKAIPGVIDVQGHVVGRSVFVAAFAVSFPRVKPLQGREIGFIPLAISHAGLRLLSIRAVAAPVPGNRLSPAAE